MNAFKAEVFREASLHLDSAICVEKRISALYYVYVEPVRDCHHSWKTCSGQHFLPCSLSVEGLQFRKQDSGSGACNQSYWNCKFCYRMSRPMAKERRFAAGTLMVVVV